MLGFLMGGLMHAPRLSMSTVQAIKPGLGLIQYHFGVDSSCTRVQILILEGSKVQLKWDESED